MLCNVILKNFLTRQSRWLIRSLDSSSVRIVYWTLTSKLHVQILPHSCTHGIFHWLAQEFWAMMMLNDSINTCFPEQHRSISTYDQERSLPNSEDITVVATFCSITATVSATETWFLVYYSSCLYFDTFGNRHMLQICELSLTLSNCCIFRCVFIPVE